MVITAQRQGETVRDYACRIIKENIVTMELKPGSLVSETELAKELGVSRTPVREALIQLGKNGMVETFPQRGTKVSLIDTDSVNKNRSYDALNDIFTQFDRVRYLSAENFNMEATVSEHKALYEAMKNKENEKADKIIVEHLSRYKEDMQELKNKYPEYFK